MWTDRLLTVGELKELLSKFPDDAQILLDDVHIGAEYIDFVLDDDGIDLSISTARNDERGRQFLQAMGIDIPEEISGADDEWMKKFFSVGDASR